LPHSTAEHRSSELHAAQFLQRGETNHAEPPRAKGRLPIEACAFLRDLHIRRLKHILGQRLIAATAVHRPAKGVGVQGFEFGSVIRSHSFAR